MAKRGQYIYEYPHPAVTADCVVFGYDGKELKVLIIKRGKEKDASATAYVGEWALPGGFLEVEKDITVAHTAARELKEETGLKISYKEFKEVGSFSDIKRDPRERVITIAHYALVKLAEVEASTDAEKAEWFSWKDIPHLAFDHDKILRDAFSRLKQDIHFEPLGIPCEVERRIAASVRACLDQVGHHHGLEQVPAQGIAGHLRRGFHAQQIGCQPHVREIKLR